MTTITLSGQEKGSDLAKVFNNRIEVYFKFENPGFKEMQGLLNRISIDKLSVENEFYAYANEKEFKYFLEFDLPFEILTPPSMLTHVKMKDQVDVKGITEWDFYPTYEAYVDIMYQFESNYPEICDVFSIGQTNEGREILFAKISDNIDVTEDEAQFMYTGTMHGDETAGYVGLLHLIDYILTNYDTDPRITGLVNDLEIWINPLANPDGTFAAGNNNIYGATRYNALGIDLNRNYPDPEDGPHPDGEEWQTETLHFMQLAENNHFVSSANLHGGAEVCNYPWDTWPTLAADDLWWQYVCHEYADTAQQYSPAGYMSGFNDGITNGYDWYTTNGNRQDYMNYFHQCREFTLEISDVKLIPESQLENHWEYNYRSYLNYIEQCSFGVRGTITDMNTGDPVYAEVYISGHDMDSSWVYSYENTGNYYRLLNQGTYDITFSAFGYFPTTIENVAVINREATFLDVQLESTTLMADFTASSFSISPGESVDFTDMSFGNIISWEWQFEGGDPSSSTEQNPSNIVYNENGLYDVSLTVYDGIDYNTVVKQEYISVMEQFLMQDGTFTVTEGLFFDAGGPAYNYYDNEDYTMVFIPEVAGEKVHVEFFMFLVEYQQNCEYDWLKIYDGMNTQANLLGTFCGGDNPGYIEATNPDGALTFQFHSDYSVNELGWGAQLWTEGELLAPEAEFCASDSTVVLGQEIEFTDLSLNNPEEWYWEFEGAIPATSSNQNPVVSYELPGVYTVSLTVSNAAGTDVMIKEDFITVEEVIGVSEKQDNQMAIYPNPAKDYIYLKSILEIKSVSVYDLLGNLVMFEKIDSKLKTLNLVALDNGLYFLKIDTNDQSFSRKFQVAR
jgi:PKD repeat protein